MCLNYGKTKKKVLLAAMAMLLGIGGFAQGNGSAGINEATQMPSIRPLMTRKDGDTGPNR